MKKKNEKILILGATGMLGNTLFTQLSLEKSLDVYGTVRSIKKAKSWFSEIQTGKLYDEIRVEKFDSVRNILEKTKPDVVINCIGIVKQSPLAENTALQIYTNALLPHKIADACKEIHSRLIHFSTDCVFSGKKGNYVEEDESDAQDIYGKTKYLGEIKDKNCITLRTSILGHGLDTHYSLIDWVLLQTKSIKGYTKVIYSGLPTSEIATMLRDYVIPNKKLHGLYHVGSNPISKYQLLQYVCYRYEKKLTIEPYDRIISDRSLVTKKFFSETSYVSPTWEELINNLYLYYKSNKHFLNY